MSAALHRLFAAGWRAGRRMIKEYFTGTAAELAYYGLLSAVPCVAAFVGIVGLVGSHPETTAAITEVVTDGVSTEAGAAARDAARGVVDRDGAAGVALGAGLITTLWAASLYLTAFRRAAYRVHGADPGTGWRTRPVQLLFTLLGILTLAVVALAMVLTERVVEELGEAVGAENATVTIWSIARWPLVLVVGVVMTAALYHLAPRNRQRGLHMPSAGPITAVVLWALATLGFEVWVANFASYDATYGALAGTVAFAIWLWISNLVLLFGLVLDLELDRAGLTESRQ